MAKKFFTNLDLNNNELQNVSSVDFINWWAIKTGETDADTALMQAYDVDWAAYTTFVTLTAGNTPTMDLSTSVTMWSNSIYYASWTDVAVADWGTWKSSWTQYWLVYADTTTSLSQITDTTVWKVMITNSWSAPSFSWDPVLWVASTTTWSMTFYNASSAFYTKITAWNATEDVTYLLPTADWSNWQVLSTNWSWQLAWTSDSWVTTLAALTDVVWVDYTAWTIIIWDWTDSMDQKAISWDATLASTWALTVSSIGWESVTLWGSFTTSWAFALTLTVTWATNVTLPTTGTLATLSWTETLENKTLTSAVLNTWVSWTAVLDDDTFWTASSTTIATSESIKAYVDSVAQGLDLKASVRVATTTAWTLASDFEDWDTVDGVVLATWDRILIKNQASWVENGIYIVQATGAPVRADDLDTWASAAWAFTFVEEWTDNEDSWFVCTNDSWSDVVWTDALSFTQFSWAWQIIAWEWLAKSWNTLSLNLNELTTITSYDDWDFVSIVDVSDSNANKKITRQNFLWITWEVVGTDDTQTLSGKTYSSAIFSWDITFDETTNDLTLSVTDQATWTATLTIPDLWGVSWDMVISNLSQTLTNKTIDADNNTLSNIGSSEVVADLITWQTDETSVDASADYVIFYDASATALRKTLVSNLIESQAQKYTAAITAASTWTITAATHGCGTASIVQVYETVWSDKVLIEVDIERNASWDVTWTTTSNITWDIVICG